MNTTIKEAFKRAVQEIDLPLLTDKKVTQGEFSIFGIIIAVRNDN
jgi:hypothetical protein